MPHTNEMAVAKGLQRGVKISLFHFKTCRKHTQCKPLNTRYKVTWCGKCQALSH